MPATAATVDDAIITANLIRRVGTPLNLAASSLPPVASTPRPYVVRRSRTCPIATATAVQITSDGIGPRSPLPKTLLKESFRIGCGAGAGVPCAVPGAVPGIPAGHGN